MDNNEEEEEEEFTEDDDGLGPESGATSENQD
jgi:hypothetical protein